MGSHYTWATGREELSEESGTTVQFAGFASFHGINALHGQFQVLSMRTTPSVGLGSDHVFGFSKPCKLRLAEAGQERGSHCLQGSPGTHERMQGGGLVARLPCEETRKA